jgi:group I intron endonuclease
MIIYSIYKVVNRLNGKVYIGFDSSWPNRQNEHKYNLKTRNQKFYLALRKYGWNNFDWQVIYQSKDGEHTLKIMENYFITEYDSYKKGYNETLGGEGTLGNILSEQTKNKISKGLKNKPKSKKHLFKMSETRKGKIQSPETLKKRSESMKRTLKLKKLNSNEIQVS